MSLILNLNDDEYPFDYISHTRIVVRGIVLNENNKIGLCVVSRDDIFGNVDLFRNSWWSKRRKRITN